MLQIMTKLEGQKKTTRQSTSRLNRGKPNSYSLSILITEKTTLYIPYLEGLRG